MQALDWMGRNWFDVLQTTGVVVSLVFAGWALRREGKGQRAASLLKLTEQHRDIWKMMFSRKELSRVLRPEADLRAEPVTDEETLFVSLLILHLNGAFGAIRAGVLREPEGLTLDIREFFGLPVPAEVWEKMKRLHDRDFVEYVEGRRGR